MKTRAMRTLRFGSGFGADEFHQAWARHDVRFHNSAIKRGHHSQVEDAICSTGLLKARCDGAWQRAASSRHRVQQVGRHVGPFKGDEVAGLPNLREFGGGEQLPVGLSV
jgi:hypothetical protein